MINKKKEDTQSIQERLENMKLEVASRK